MDWKFAENQYSIHVLNKSRPRLFKTAAMPSGHAQTPGIETMNLHSSLAQHLAPLQRHIPKAATFGVLAACLLAVGVLEADPLETRRASAEAYCNENPWDLPNCEQPTAITVSDGPTVVTVDWSEIAAYLDADDAMGREDAEAGWAEADFPEARPQRLAAAY